MTGSLDLAAARLMVDIAVDVAADLGIAVSCAVVNASGHELLSVRMDEAAWFTADVARTKARTSVVMKCDSGDLSELKSDYPELIDLIAGQLSFQPTTLAGGVVVMHEDVMVGGIGVSGAHPDQDVACAQAGVDAWRASLAS